MCISDVMSPALNCDSASVNGVPSLSPAYIELKSRQVSKKASGSVLANDARSSRAALSKFNLFIDILTVLLL